VPESTGEASGTKEEEKKEEKKTVHRIKLEALAKDLSKIVSRLERKAQREKEQKIKEELEKRKKELAQPEANKEPKPTDLAPPKEEEKKPQPVKEEEQQQQHRRLHRVLSHSEEGGSQLNDEDDDNDDDDGGSQDMDEAIRQEARGAAGGRQALIDLGIDEDIIDGDPDLARALAESMLADREAEAQEKREQERAEAERKKKEKEEEDKRKKKEEQEQLEKEAAEAGIIVQTTKVKYTKLRVSVGDKEIAEDTDASRFLFKVLRDRLRAKAPKEDAGLEETQEFSLSPEVVKALKQIHLSYRDHEDLSVICQLPQATCPLLEDFGITQ
jgi:hypothetical protein